MSEMLNKNLFNFAFHALKYRKKILSCLLLSISITTPLLANDMDQDQYTSISKQHSQTNTADYLVVDDEVVCDKISNLRKNIYVDSGICTGSLAYCYLRIRGRLTFSPSRALDAYHQLPLKLCNIPTTASMHTTKIPSFGIMVAFISFISALHSYDTLKRELKLSSF